MLVLSRRVGELIVIAEGQIEIKILALRQGQVSIGINAPPHIAVDRQEIFIKKQQTYRALLTLEKQVVHGY